MVQRGRVCSLLCLVGVLGCLGCGSGRVPVHPVRGKVLVDGQPATRALVTFHPVSDKRPEAVHPVGHVDEQGQFTLSSFQQGDGAPEGEYQVTVVWYLATPNPDRARGGDEYLSVNYLPGEYGRLETSPLKAQITRGRNELSPFELQRR